jgi:hypothetical protein
MYIPHLLKIIHNVISCLGVCILGGINVAVGHSSISTMVFFIALIIPVPEFELEI